MVDRVSLPPTPAPAAPPADAPPAVDAAISVLAGGKATRVDATPVAPAPRPAWLPEKFKSPEDMAHAYGELERRLGGPQPSVPIVVPTEAPRSDPRGVPGEAAGIPTPSPAPAGNSDLVTRLTQEWAQTGQVSVAARQEFTQKTGLPDTFIDQQITHLEAQNKRTYELAVHRLGGEGAVQELTEWAKKRLSDSDRAAFNRAVYSNDQALAQLALDGLAAKYESEVGRAPRIMAGRKPQPEFGGVVPFQSHAEWSAARKDPKYKTDPAYRSQVEERLRASMARGLI